MKYYIQETKWKQIFANVKSVKGIHSKNEDRIRRDPLRNNIKRVADKIR